MAARGWILAGTIAMAGCGRTPAIGASDDAASGDDDTTTSATSVGPVTTDNPVTTLDPDTTGDPPPVVECAGDTFFYEGFDADTGGWGLHPRWSVEARDEALSGDSVLRGFWGDFDVGCPVSAEASILIDLTAASTAALEFWHVGSVCTNDTLRVSVIDTTTGSVDLLPEPVPDPLDWGVYGQDLTPWVGSVVFIALGFDNVCGDACGVDWRIDDVRVCATF